LYFFVLLQAEFKRSLADLVISSLAPVRLRAAQITAADAEAELKVGAAKAREIATPILEKMMKTTGFRQ
jgi:hypothetical protein